ncbi:MAG: hypothetical protein OCD76_20995, partial [Reichenbachiella sp.]
RRIARRYQQVMNSRKNLTFIIAVITLRVFIQIILVFDSHTLFDLLGNFYTILFFALEITLILFLYFFIVNQYSVKINFIPALIISLLSVYQLFDVLFIFGIDPSVEQSTNDTVIEQLLIRGLPGLIGLTCTVIFAFQLIKNVVENTRANLSIKLVGKAFLVQIVATFAISSIPLLTGEFSWVDKIVTFSYILPFALMLKMFLEEWQLKGADNMT